jgi:hypothetical protein
MRRALRHPTWRGLLRVALVLVGLPGCNAFAPQTPLPFQTLAQAEFLSGTDGTPRLWIAATAQEGAAFAVNLMKASAPPDAVARLYQLDFDSTFALMVERAPVGRSGSFITIETVVRQGDQVTVQVRFGSPAPNLLQASGFMRPYHLVTISKGTTWGSRFISS